MAEQEASRTTSIAKEKAYIALMDAITQGVADIRGSTTYSAGDQSGTLLRLAHAFRLTAGGPQTGNVETK